MYLGYNVCLWSVSWRRSRKSFQWKTLCSSDEALKQVSGQWLHPHKMLCIFLPNAIIYENLASLINESSCVQHRYGVAWAVFSKLWMKTSGETLIYDLYCLFCFKCFKSVIVVDSLSFLLAMSTGNWKQHSFANNMFV